MLSMSHLTLLHKQSSSFTHKQESFLAQKELNTYTPSTHPPRLDLICIHADAGICASMVMGRCKKTGI